MPLLEESGSYLLADEAGGVAENERNRGNSHAGNVKHRMVQDEGLALNEYFAPGQAVADDDEGKGC